MQVEATRGTFLIKIRCSQILIYSSSDTFIICENVAAELYLKIANEESDYN